MQSNIQPSTQTHISTQLNSQPHLNARSNTDDTTAQISSMAEVADSNLISAHVTNPSKSQNVLLATAVVLIKDSSNNVHKVRALLDGASQSNLLLNRYIQSVQDKSFQVKLSCLVIEKITQDIPNFYIDPTQINIPQNLSLADQNYYEAGEVQLLLGAGIFYDMLLPGKISLGKNMPVCQNSRLGWFLAGNITMFMDNQVDLNSNPQISCNLTMTQCNKQLHEQIEKFWAIEECSHMVPLTKEEEDLYKLQRIVALCLRFKRNLTVNRKNRIAGAITGSEQDEALLVLATLAQQTEFRKDIIALKQNGVVSAKSKLKTLCPFLDERGLIRVGGRLGKAPVPYDKRFPIVLSKNHALTKLIIRDEHYRNLHAGPQAVLCAVRRKFWPLSGKIAVRSALKSCIACFRVKPVDIVRVMGELPQDRVTAHRPFFATGDENTAPQFWRLGRIQNLHPGSDGVVRVLSIKNCKWCCDQSYSESINVNE
nr:unnamed protein product [Callosobruchus analis]